MQNINSIERFLFNGSIYLIEESSPENKNYITNQPYQYNTKKKEDQSKTESEFEKELVLIPLKLLCSIINLYFYSKNPKKSYDTLKPFFIKEVDHKKMNKNFSRLSSIKSQTSIFASESNFYIDNDISLDSQNAGNKHFIPRNLEDFILIKLPQNEIYMTNYDLDEGLIEYKHKESGKNFKFKFKHNSMKEKNYIKILIIIEGYKYSIKNTLLVNPVMEQKKRNMINNNMSIRNKTLMTKRKNSISKNVENVRQMSLEMINTEFIINFLDNLINNKFKILIIDEAFFQEEQNLLKIFTSFLLEFKEIKIKINLFEEEDNNIDEENLIGGETVNKETFASAFNDRFNLDTHENKQQININNNVKEKNIYSTNNKINENNYNNFQLIIIDASNTFMNNKGFIKAILPLAQKSPFLEKLLLNNNYLTDDIFIRLNELSSNYNIKIIDLSYNKIKGINLSSNLRLLITTFFELELINLKGNLVPSSFLNRFNPIKFNNLLINIRKILNEGNEEEKSEKIKLKIDLRENMIDKEKIGNQFYLWQSELFEEYLANKRKTANENLEEEIQENENIIKNSKEKEKNENNNINNINNELDSDFNEVLYNTENFILLLDFPYKGPNYLEENKVNINITKAQKKKKNEYKIEINKLILKNNIDNKNLDFSFSNNEKGSLDYYRQIFKFLFLINYYFDPILNSFSHTYSAFIHKFREPLCPNNENEIIENQLKKYLSLDNNEINLYKDSFAPKYKNIMKKYFSRQIYNMPKAKEIKNREMNNNDENEMDSEKIKLKYDYKEIPLYEAKEIYYGYKYYTDKYESIFEMSRNLFNLKQSDFFPETGILFNPNSYIKHLFFFYKFILSLNNNNNFSLLLSTYNKLISRIKIECYLAEKERDFYSLQILSIITYGLGLKPYDIKIRKKYELLKIQTKLIDEGLEHLINFIDKEDVTLINSYYDIFMTEATNINYQSELTFIAEYIQFLRNNLIRKKIYEDIYEDKNSVTYITKVQNDFDDIYKRYMKISPILIEQIPEGIKYKDICVHPNVLDYLEIASLKKDMLEKDLELITDYVNTQNLNNSTSEKNNINNSVILEYGRRNIFNRLTFLFMKNTKKEYPKKYGYSLSKKNKYLKLSRLLFRFNNGLDGKNIYLKLLSINKNYTSITHYDIKNAEMTILHPSLYNIVYCISNFNTNLKTNNKEIQRLNKAILSGIDVIDNIQRLKLEILKFSPKKKIYPLIDLKLELKNITKEKRKIFNKISYKFYSKLLEINNNNNSRIIHYNRMYRKIKELIVFTLNIRNHFKNEEMNENFLMIIYKEIFYICIKYMNRDNFNFSFLDENEDDINNNIKRFSFGILYIMLFYLEFNLGLKIYIKEFLLDLYIHRYFPPYCKHALNALNNNYRYDWIMSSYEIHNRLFYNNQIRIKIYFTYDYYEIYYIDEHTTVYDLFLDIFNNSQFFKSFRNKKLYWIYLVQNDPLKDELLPDEMKENYEQEINEMKNINQKLNNTNNTIDENISSINNINNKNENSLYRNSSSFDNSTFLSNNINLNLNSNKKKEKRKKLDEDYLQYLNDNKGFNKEIFSLDSDSFNNMNNSQDFDSDIDNTEKNNENIKKINLNDNNEKKTFSSFSSESISNSNSKSGNDNNKNNNNEEEKNKKKKSLKENINNNNNKEKNEEEKEKEKKTETKYMNKRIKRINLKSNEFVLEFLGNIEDKLHFNFAKNLNINMMKNKSDDEEESNNSKNEEYNDNTLTSSYEGSDGPHIEKMYDTPGKILPDDAFKFDIIFNYFHFQICPRFFTYNYLNEKIMEQNDKSIENTSAEEQDNIFELISKYFTYDKRNNIVKYDLGKKIGILLIANMRLYNKELNRSSKLIKYKKENLYLYFFPKNILKHSAFKNMMERMENLINLRMNSTVNKNSLETEFIKLCMNYKEFYSSIYENVFIEIINNDSVELNGINENLELIHNKYVNICINFEGISLMDKDNYQKILFFEYSDIVKIYLKTENIIKINIYNESKKYPVELKLNFIFNYKDDLLEDTSTKNLNKKRNNKILNFNEFDAYFLYEDIISFIQFNLLTNTQTKTVQNIEDFNFIFMQRNKHQNFSAVKRINDIDITRFKIVKRNNGINAVKKNKKEKKEEKNKIEEKEEDKIKSISQKDILSQIIKVNPQFAMMKELREKEKEITNIEIKSDIKKINKNNNISNNLSIISNNENEDDFFSDVKVTGINANKEKNKIKKKEEQIAKIKSKNYNIENLVRNDNKTEDIMKEIEEEQLKWEERINSSKSSFSITSSIKDDESNNEYMINLYEFNNLNDKMKKHIIKEKKLESKIESARRLLKDKDLVSEKTRELLKKEEKERKEKNEDGEYSESNKTDSDATYLSFLSKNQRYPF